MFKCFTGYVYGRKICVTQLLACSTVCNIRLSKKHFRYAKPFRISCDFTFFNQRCAEQLSVRVGGGVFTIKPTTVTKSKVTENTLSSEMLNLL